MFCVRKGGPQTHCENSMAKRGAQDDQGEHGKQKDAREKVRAIDPNQLAKHFESDAVEKRWISEWESRGIYH